MAVKERPRAKKDVKAESKDVAELEPEVEVTLEETEHTPEVVVRRTRTAEVTSETQEASTSETTGQKVRPRTVQTRVEPEPPLLLPSWGTSKDSEWMYTIPSRREDLELWAEEWADFLLKWSQSRRLHVVSVAVFLAEMPFKDIVGKSDAFRILGDRLVDQDMAEWWDNKHRQLRVYWRPLEDWADMVYSWSLRTGSVLIDVGTLIVQEYDEEFGTLPERDLHRVMDILVSTKRAEWVDQKRGAVRLRAGY
ncbi:MAG: hypothetical protein HXY34_03155 [Candidatus Thorarchaeota archaeon]|nr:hypothetical protein [Candidatus Thorarchaeota archaeon]